MTAKIVGTIAVLVVVGVGGYLMYQGFTKTEDATGVVPEQEPASTISWGFDPAGTDEADAPLTAVSVVVSGKTYDAGTEQGNCFPIAGSNWELVAGESSGAICWWAGGGTELGVFQEGGELVVKRGILDEGTAEGGSVRGNFTTVLVLKDDSNSVLVKTKLGKSESALGVRITPLSIVEDSRCPTDVQCIQAGTVRVKARVESGGTSTEGVFTLGIVETREKETITLVSVEPGKKAGKPVAEGEYLFTFGVEKR